MIFPWKDTTLILSSPRRWDYDLRVKNKQSVDITDCFYFFGYPIGKYTTFAFPLLFTFGEIK